MAASHWIRETHSGWSTTHCGRSGYKEGADEFSTTNGDRFEAYAGLRQVTCKRCLNSAKRISEGSWGCTRTPSYTVPRS